MKLVEKHIIKKNHKYYPELYNLCRLSKNLYNATLYTVRQHYFNTGKYMNYCQVNKLFAEINQSDYCALPRKVSQQTQKLVDQNFKSFFTLLKQQKIKAYNKSVKIPKYLDKLNGKQVVMYTKQALSFKHKDFVKLSGTNIKIKTDKQSISFVRIVPKNGYIVIELGYEVLDVKPLQDNQRYTSIDLGINNLATITSNVFNPIIINGRPVKSINQYYNKQLAYYKSILAVINNKHTSKRIQTLNRIRNNKISDYFHKSTRFIVNQLVSNNINTLVIGYNKGWKQDTTMGKVNNQKFVQIPFLTFINMLKYKCALVGINVIEQEESYTSKCSFLDNEGIGKHDNYLGQRVKRGLFRTATNIYINADINGSYNILKKYLISKEVWDRNLFLDCIEVCSTLSVFTVKL